MKRQRVDDPSFYQDRAEEKKSELRHKWCGGYYACLDCGGLIDVDSEWEGETEGGKEKWTNCYRCEDCGRYKIVKINMEAN